jgi:hypothetical protein
MTTTKTAPYIKSAIYLAAAHLERSGPLSSESLFVAIDFGPTRTRQAKLEHAYQIDWLQVTPAGTIDLTESARQHFAGKRPKEGYVGQIVPAQYRPNVFASQGLSKKFIPSRRGQRDDIPAWSVKLDGHSIKSIGGGEA